MSSGLLDGGDKVILLRTLVSTGAAFRNGSKGFGPFRLILTKRFVRYSKNRIDLESARGTESPRALSSLAWVASASARTPALPAGPFIAPAFPPYANPASCKPATDPPLSVSGRVAAQRPGGVKFPDNQHNPSLAIGPPAGYHRAMVANIRFKQRPAQAQAPRNPFCVTIFELPRFGERASDRPGVRAMFREGGSK